MIFDHVNTWRMTDSTDNRTFFRIRTDIARQGNFTLVDGNADAFG